ncbi:MAG: hypothetical protein ACE5NJ_03660 [Thermodesulfobacteriota bacterium]
MEKRITFYRKPHLEKPDFIAAWPGMRNVALKAANLLKDKLKAEEFAEIGIEKYIRQIRGISNSRRC